MAEATIEHPKHNWLAWALGIGGAIVTASLLWIIQFLVFGFEEYVKDVAATEAVPMTTISAIRSDINTIKTSIEAQEAANIEFRKEQRADMRNLVSIMSRRVPANEQPATP